MEPTELPLMYLKVKYIRGSSVGSIGSMGSANHWICHRDSFVEFICY